MRVEKSIFKYLRSRNDCQIIVTDRQINVERNMNNFNLAWFRPIEFNEFSQYFGLSYEECKEPYLKWSNEYKRLTKKLYYRQYE
jgi:DNA-directed RNA polymerase specialized sigma subunit